MKLNKISKNIKKIASKRIFLRVDFNVAIKDGKIAEEEKIIAALPTIRFLLRYKARLIIATHLGQPKGRDKKYSTALVAKRLGQLLGGRRVKFAGDILGREVFRQAQALLPGKILFLENLRFDKREEKNNDKFARSLASLAEVYVNEAFSVSHRKHASVCAIKKYLPAYAGFLLAAEIDNLDKIKKPKRPLVILMGGAKINTKINLIRSLESKASKILIGGALANNFFKARKMEVGRSLLDKESIRIAKKIKNKKIILPLDVVVRGPKGITAKSIDDVGKMDEILDIGPKTIKLFSREIRQANTIVWNGPLGMFEDKNFKHGTLSLAQAVACRAQGPAFGVAGGGETIEAIKMARLYDYLDWVSTGGGAMLAYLGGEAMPGL